MKHPRARSAMSDGPEMASDDMPARTLGTKMSADEIAEHHQRHPRPEMDDDDDYEDED